MTNKDPVTGQFVSVDAPTAEGQFWNRVPVRGEGCWLWGGAIGGNGYGTLTVAGRTLCAHRFSWELHNGPIPDGLLACHKCDVPACVNPAHLFLGTHTDNLRDCIAKGRARYGTGRRKGRTGRPSATCKLTPAEVLEIRRRYTHGPETQQEIASSYRVSAGCIQAVISGRTHRYVA